MKTILIKPGKAIVCILIAQILVSTGCKPKEIYDNNAAAGRYYNINGFKMYCEVYGKGKPLLMIHGNAGDISCFKNNIPYFSKKYKVIVADSRAQGRSVDTCSRLTFEMMSDDFSTLLDTMHIAKAYVLGWSDGGISALLLAMRHPGKVIKLASTGANLWPDSTAIKPEDWKNEYKYYQKNYNHTWFTNKGKNDWKIFMLDWAQPNLKLAELQKITCPALIIAGDHDEINEKHTRLIQQNIKGSKLWIVAHSSHATLIDQKDKFNNTVDKFFSQN